MSKCIKFIQENMPQEEIASVCSIIKKYQDYVPEIQVHHMQISTHCWNIFWLCHEHLPRDSHNLLYWTHTFSRD